MEVLWKLQRGTVGEVAEALPPPPLAYNTVLTTLRILEQKGHVSHDEAGRAYVYFPLVEREVAAQSAVKQVVSKFFGNSTGALALRLIENERPSNEELDRLRALIDKYEEKP
jgi:predicted transcriptional regulator